MKIVIPTSINLLETHISKIKSLGDVTVYIDIPKTEEEILKRINGAELIVVKRININANIINKCPLLRHIIVPSVSTESIDKKTAMAKGISVMNCPTQNTHAVAELTIALMFAITRQIVESNMNIRKHIWKRTMHMGTEVAGKKLGIIGYGNIGKKVAEIAKSLGMQVVFANSK